MSRVAKSFLDSFKGQVFIDDLSPEVVESAGRIGIWHSFDTPQELVSVSYLEGSEGQGMASGLMQPRHSYDHVVSLSQRNSVGLRAAIGAGTYEAAFDLKTATLLSHQIDWSIKPTLSLTYLTEVIESFDGAEQRVATRDKPRMSLSYQIPLVDDDRYTFESDFVNQTTLMFVPIWPLQVDIAGIHAQGSRSISLASSNAYIQICPFLLIFEDKVFEVVEVEGVSGDVVHIADGLKHGYTPAARVIPLVVGRHSDSTDSFSVIDSIDLFAMKVDADEALFKKPAPALDFDTFHTSEVTETWGDYTETELVGERFVLPFRPDRSADVSLAFQRLRETFDPQIGARSVYERTQGAVRTFSYDFKFFSEQERQRFEDFADLHNGAQKEFYFEGPGKALDIVEHTDNLLTVKNARLTRNSTSKAPGLSIKLYNGSRVYRHIKSITKINDQLEQLELNDTIPTDIDAIYPLFLGRFEGDNFTYTFETSGISTITKTIKQLIYADSIENRRVIESE